MMPGKMSVISCVNNEGVFSELQIVQFVDQQRSQFIVVSLKR